MALGISLPVSGGRVGPGCTVTVTGLASPAVGHLVKVELNAPSGTTTIMAIGGKRTTTASSTQDVVAGYIQLGFFASQGEINGVSSVGLADGATVSIGVIHFDATGTFIESANFTGYLWDPNSFLPGLLRALWDHVSTGQSDVITLASDISLIKAAVIRNYT